MELCKFQLLLNNLSNEFSERNLQSLIHICGDLIPGGQRDNVRNGWDVFSILRHQNAIGDSPEKLKFLLQIVRELRPRRRDLVSMVKRYIEENCEEAETIIDGVESNCDFSFAPRLVRDDGNLGCSFRSRCFNCSCSCGCCDSCCCCVILSIFFLLMVVLSALVWYTHIFPEVQDYRITRPYVGPFAIAVFGFLALSFASCVVYLYFRQQSTPQVLSPLSSVIDNNSTSNRAVRGDGSRAPSVSTRTSSNLPRTMVCSGSAGRVTGSSSFASSRAPSVSTRTSSNLPRMIARSGSAGRVTRSSSFASSASCRHHSSDFTDFVDFVFKQDENDQKGKEENGSSVELRFF